MKLRFGTRTNTLVKFHSPRTNCNIVVFHLAMIALRIISTADSWFALRLIRVLAIVTGQNSQLLSFFFSFLFSTEITQRLLRLARFFSFIGDRWQFRRRIVIRLYAPAVQIIQFLPTRRIEDKGLKADDSRSNRSLRLQALRGPIVLPKLSEIGRDSPMLADVGRG